jgi:hypothetical protein
MPIGLVLSGGASLGAIQVGMLHALYEQGVAPDLIVATSVGAVNGAFIASRPPTVATADALGEMWRKIHRDEVFPPSSRRSTADDDLPGVVLLVIGTVVVTLVLRVAVVPVEVSIVDAPRSMELPPPDRQHASPEAGSPASLPLLVIGHSCICRPKG